MTCSRRDPLTSLARLHVSNRASVGRAFERRLQTTTEQLMGGRPSSIIAHRLTTIERCGYIFVLHGGWFVESGTYSQLIVAGGRNAAFVGR